MHLLCAASSQDSEACIHWSRKLGFLTGNETKTMNDAHVTSLLLLAQPFSSSSPQPYSFATQTITEQVRSAIPTMLRERLTPPPDEVYSLHRKLSGCFLFCTKIRASIPAARIFKEYTDRYSFWGIFVRYVLYDLRKKYGISSYVMCRSIIRFRQTICKEQKMRLSGRS